MTNLLSQLDAASPADVPALCLRIADELGGEAEAEGWRALGVLGKVPENMPFEFGTLAGKPRWVFLSSKHFLDDERGDPYVLDTRWNFAIHDPIQGAAWRVSSRSAALRAAARAFGGMPDDVKREILDSATETVK